MSSKTTAIPNIYKTQRGSNLLLFILLALVTGSVFRISLLALYPVIVFLIITHFRLKLMQQALILLACLTICLLISFSNGFYWQYNLLSLYHMVPFLLLLFAVPSYESLEEELLPQFMAVLSVVALLNNIAGFIQYFRNRSDDAFVGIYSTYSVSLYGLVILNLTLFAYYFSLFAQSKKKWALYKSAFFLLSGIWGFYGAGLIAFIGAFILSFLSLRLKPIIKITFISVISLYLVYHFISWLRPEALYYYEVSAKRLVGIDKNERPRKLISFYNYASAYPEHPKDFLFGSGPGTFNSRSAFMAGSPDHFNALPFLKSDDQPYYFKHYAYTLWNKNNTSQALYQDGFRNQPFSSLLAFLGEYGLLFTVLLFWALADYYKRVIRLAGKKPFSGPVWFFKFLVFFLLLLLCIENYLEYPEVILLMLFSMKLTHIQLLRNNLHHSSTSTTAGPS